MAIQRNKAAKPAAKAKTKEQVAPTPVQSEQTAQPTAQSNPQPNAGLSLQDLVGLAQIVQVTSQRGAFRAEELADVGALYNKLLAFLESAGAIAKPADGAATGEQK